MEEFEKENSRREKHCDLKKIKELYEDKRKKYSLPEFKSLNENFEIENLEEESELILKQIRKHMTEKIFYILRTLEAFMNPSNAPMFVFNVLKSFSEGEKELVQELYKKLAKYEIEAFGMEAIYDEKKEADFIKKVSEEWKSISEDLIVLYKAMKENHDKDSKKSPRSYFG
jgi:hypothetical protein